MKKLTSIFSLFVLLAAICNTSFASTIAEGNERYAQGDFEGAIAIYESILAEDKMATDLYYNLGNAYYKSDQIPSAILNYERALKLKPDHEDVLFNLAMANKKTVDKIDRLPELFIGSTWKTLVTSRTVNDWAGYCIMLLFLSLLFFVGYLALEITLIKKVNFYAGVFFLILSMSSWLLAAQHQSIIDESAEAIIFKPTITVLSAPNDQSEKLFTLHEGTKVTLLENVESWQEIKLPNGNVGWVKVDVLENI